MTEDPTERSLDLSPAWPERWRDRFPILAETTYLVTHSLGAMPRGVEEKLSAFTRQWATRGVRAWAEGWWDTPVEVGNLLARIMNAPKGSVTMHQNVSVVQAIVASAIDFGAGRDRVVYTDQNFPSNSYVWESWRRYGAQPVVVPSEADGRVPTERLLEAIDERTAIVPISHVCFRTSFLQDAAAICARAREVGALVLLDAYQSLGTVPIDVEALGVDMVCGGSVKWLCGGPGAGYLYVREELARTLRPAITGWAAHSSPFAFDMGEQQWADGARRFLHGTPAVASLLQASAGYEVVLEVGVERIRAWSMHLLERLRRGLEERGFTIHGPRSKDERGGTLTVALHEDEHGPAFVAALEARGILVDHRPEAGLRVSPHFYTLEEEVDAFISAVTELRASGAWRGHVTSGAY